MNERTRFDIRASFRIMREGFKSSASTLFRREGSPPDFQGMRVWRASFFIRVSLRFRLIGQIVAYRTNCVSDFGR